MYAGNFATLTTQHLPPCIVVTLGLQKKTKDGSGMDRNYAEKALGNYSLKGLQRTGETSF